MVGVAPSEAPRLKVGIVTDTHIQVDAAAFEKTLRYFRDFSNDVELGEPWIVPLPLGTEKPLAWDAQSARMPVPQFRGGAVLKTRTVVGADRKANMEVRKGL